MKLPIQADASDPEQLRAALEQAKDEFGLLDLIVNAVSAVVPDPDRPFGGGPLRDAEALRTSTSWTVTNARQAFVFLSEGVPAGASKLIQITGGSARRAMPGRGLWRRPPTRPAQ